MNLLTLINEEGILLASGKRVFNASETGALTSSVDTANQLVKTLAESELKIEQAVQAGREKGYKDGRIAGLEDARNTLATQLIKLNERAEDLVNEQRQESVRLALLIVRKITEGLAPEQTLAALATSAAKECIDESNLTLKVHPDRLEAVRAALDSQSHDNAGRKSFSDIVADASLDIDDCIIDSKLGAIVADLNTQLNVLEISLTLDV